MMENFDKRKDLLANQKPFRARHKTLKGHEWHVRLKVQGFPKNGIGIFAMGRYRNFGEHKKRTFQKNNVPPLRNSWMFKDQGVS